jgi:hypothetical protein
MPIDVGDTFLIQTGSPSDPDRNHLLVAISDIPIDAGGMTLFVSISSIKEIKRHDKTCEILATDSAHPFITKDSFVDYSMITQALSETILRRAIPDWDGNRTRHRLPGDLIERIRQGVFSSPRVKRWARDDLAKCQRLERRRDDAKDNNPARPLNS